MRPLACLAANPPFSPPSHLAVALSTNAVNNAFLAYTAPYNATANMPDPKTTAKTSSKSSSKTSSKSKSSKSDSSKSDSSKVHKLALKGSSKVVNEFVSPPSRQTSWTLTQISLSIASTPYCKHIAYASPDTASWLTFAASKEASTLLRTSPRK